MREPVQTPPRLPGGTAFPATLAEDIPRFGPRLQALPAALYRAIPTGFDWIDEACGGGMLAQDLIAIAGKQNVGKTTIALQIARNIAVWATRDALPIVPMLLSYEHDSWDMFTRLLCMESYIRQPGGALKYRQINTAISAVKDRFEGPQEQDFLDLLWAELPEAAAAALHHVSQYSARLILAHGNRVHTSVDVVQEILAHYRDARSMYVLPIIDYLQTIPPPIEYAQHAIAAPEVVHMVNIDRLKDLAMAFNVPVITVAAVDAEALKKQRPVHIEDIFGPIQSQYTIDRGLILNPDVTITKADDRQERISMVRLALEKNRKGPSELEFSHRRHGSAFYLDPSGDAVDAAASFQQDRIRIEEVAEA